MYSKRIYKDLFIKELTQLIELEPFESLKVGGGETSSWKWLEQGCVNVGQQLKLLMQSSGGSPRRGCVLDPCNQ